MTPSFTEMLLSPQFTFLLGEDRVPVTVHASVMSNLSEPFDRLINGSMKEAQEKCAVLPHTDQDVFLALIEFAYRGDYDGRSWAGSLVKVKVNEKTAAEEEQNEDQTENDEGDYKEEEYEDAYHVEEAIYPDWYDPEHHPSRRERFVNKSYPPLTDSRSPYDLSMDVAAHLLGPFGRAREHRFLLNAKMYCLADYYIIPALKNLALRKLHEMLKQCMDIKHSWVKYVVALVAYAYSSDNIADHGTCSERDPLREEVLGFVMAHFEYFEDHPAFQRLLTGGGQLSTDVVSCLNADRRVEKTRVEAAIRYRHRVRLVQSHHW